eukprot:g2698.t1
MSVKKFRFTEAFKPGDGEALASALVGSAAVRAALGLGDLTPEQAEEPLTVTELRKSVVHMGFFDRIEEAGLVTETGYIRQMAEEMHGGVPVSDLLRDALLNDESEHAALFSAEDRDEFIFRVFRYVCVGGSLCQHDENWQPYLDAARALYKELVSVHRANASGDVEVSSTLLELRGRGVHDGRSPHSFAYIVIDPKTRHVTAWRWERKAFW